METTQWFYKSRQLRFNNFFAQCAMIKITTRTEDQFVGPDKSPREQGPFRGEPMNSTSRDLLAENSTATGPCWMWCLARLLIREDAKDNEDAMGSFIPNSRHQARSHGFLLSLPMV